jgi:PadR family transcriptional regulator
MARRENDLYQGTLDMLVLKALTRGPQHGYGLMRWIRQISDDELQVKEGALYPALHRLEARGWVEAEWGLSEENRQAKFYTLNPGGRRQLREDTATWTRYVAAVAKVLEAA